MSTSRRGQPVLNFLPVLFSLFAFVFVLLILIAGTNNALSDFYYLKTDTSGLSIPSKLSSSTFLADLSSVSGADLTGQTQTASSLGLADSYNLLLLTSCAHFADGTISCDRPSIGFWFDPASDLQLDSTALQGTFPDALISALATYHRTSGFLANAYIISAALVAFTPIAGLLGNHNRTAAVIAAVMASFASVFLLGAGIAAVVVFRGLDTQINAAFAQSGLRSTLGVKPVALGFIAFALVLLTAITFVIRARSPARPRARVVARSVGTEYDTKGVAGGPEGDEGGAATGNAGPKPGLWKRIPTWKNHKYVQVEKQPSLLRTDVPGHQEAVIVTSPSGTQKRAEGDRDDWAAEDEYTAGGRAIPMLSIGGNKREKNMDTSYEPYSGRSGDT